MELGWFSFPTRLLAGALSIALLAGGACARGGEEQPKAAPANAPAPAAAIEHEAERAPAPIRAANDAPLPAEDEIPSFLRGAGDGAAAPEKAPDLPTDLPLDESGLDAFAADEQPAQEPTLQELMRSVSVGGDEESPGDSWAFIGGGSEAATEDDTAVEAAAPGTGDSPPESASPGADAAAGEVLEATAAAIEAPRDEDPCEPLRRLIEARNRYLRRTAAERDTFGYVESKEDVAALRLLQGLHRCSIYPDDEDCGPRPIEVDISEVEIPSHQISRDPSDLNAEGRDPNEIPHDPRVLELLHQLARCEKSEMVQPLLQGRR